MCKDTLICASEASIGSPVDEGADDKFHFHAEHSKTVGDFMDFVSDGTVGVEKPTGVMFDTDANSGVFIIRIFIVAAMYDGRSGTKLNRRYHRVLKRGMVRYPGCAAGSKF